MGISPTGTEGWAHWEVVPQPGALEFVNATLPSPRGLISVFFSQGKSFPIQNGVSLELGVPQGTRVTVCLPPTHSSWGGALNGTPTLFVDDSVVDSAFRGRLLCTVEEVVEGVHQFTRLN